MKIHLFNHERLLKPGMSATADIESKRVKNALVVPIQSVTIRGATEPKEAQKQEKSKVTITSTAKATESRQGLFVVKSGRAWFRPVKTGTTDNTHIIVTEGLKPGEEVVSGSYSAITNDLKEGSMVKPPKQ